MTDLSPDRWQRMASLFDQALHLTEPDRTAFLERECGTDHELRTGVEQLLESAERASGFLDKPLYSEAGQLLRGAVEDLQADGPAPSPEGAADPHLVTTRSLAASGIASEPIGPYRLLQKIGEGGMGEVYLAEQSEPIQRQVALKLIKAGLDTRQVVARFEAERQALALMDHPGIAKVYDAGETPRGLPYFAMEYVKGEPITSYCDRHRLGTPERLELFARVCEAVQHAHQKGVIHRDLKPSNVLVSIVGEKPQPKVIDFGVAKATAQRLTEKTMFTELGVLIGTPEYMSPEQAEMTGLDVDTRTDVYALGVMLYELLTGALPFESKELHEAGFEEIRRRIREVDPPKPSTRVRTQGERSTEAARNRRTDPGKLVSRLRGDLDWIVMKALEKDRTRRYGTPSEMAADLVRHLSHEPVLAGPPSAAYRARKFIRRHRFGVAAASLAVMGLAGFGVMMALQARAIARERDRAERVSEFLVELFRVSDPSEARGNSITAREVLDRGAARIDKELKNEPEVQAQLMLTMGWVYINLGLLQNAETILQRSVDIRRRLLGPEDPQTLTSMIGLARAVMDRGNYAKAEALYRKVLEGRRRALGPEHEDTIISLNGLGVVLERQGRYPEAGKIYREGLELARRILGEAHNETLWLKHNLAYMDQEAGRYAEAETAYRDVLEQRRRTQGEDHPDTIWALDSLAGLYMYDGRLEEAERLYRKALDLTVRVNGPESLDASTAMGNLANVLSRRDQNAEAEELYKKSGEISRRELGDEHPSVLIDMNNLAVFYTRQGKLQEAEALLKEVLSIQPRVWSKDHPNTFHAKGNLAVVYARQGRQDQARGLFREAIEGKRRVLGVDNPSTLLTTYRMGCAAALWGRRTEALDWIRQAVEKGYKDADRMAQDPDCKSLRGDAEFERLLEVARANAPPSGS